MLLLTNVVQINLIKYKNITRKKEKEKCLYINLSEVTLLSHPIECNWYSQRYFKTVYS